MPTLWPSSRARDIAVFSVIVAIDLTLYQVPVWTDDAAKGNRATANVAVLDVLL
jgi:hypothetical protein